MKKDNNEEPGCLSSLLGLGFLVGILLFGISMCSGGGGETCFGPRVCS